MKIGREKDSDNQPVVIWMKSKIKGKKESRKRKREKGENGIMREERNFGKKWGGYNRGREMKKEMEEIKKN